MEAALINAKIIALCQVFQSEPVHFSQMGENHFRNEMSQETYLVLTDDEADDMFIEQIEKYPHKVAIDTIKAFLPANVDADALERIKGEVKVEIYDEIVNILLDCEGDDRKGEYIQEVFDKYDHCFFLSCDDNEVYIGEYNIYRM